MVKVINGVNELASALDGRTVGEIRGLLAQALNIDPAAVPVLNGDTAADSTVLREGDELEFVKPAGTKG